MFRIRRSCCLYLFLSTLFVFFLLNQSLNLNGNQQSNDDPFDADADADEEYELDQSSRLRLSLFKLLIRLDKLIAYFESNYKNVNLDGLFGIQMARANLKRSVDESTADKKSPLHRHLMALLQRANTLAKSVAESVKLSNPTYFDQFKRLINTPFELDPNLELDSSRLSFSDTISSDESIIDSQHFDEQFSDSCLVGLMEKSSSSSCQVSDECLEFFAQPDATGYYLTHQLLYFMIAEHFGCSSSVYKQLTRFLFAHKSLNRDLLAQANDNSIDDADEIESIRNRVLNYYCTKIYNESDRLYSDYSEPSSFPRDLFIEQSKHIYMYIHISILKIITQLNSNSSHKKSNSLWNCWV